MFKLQIDTSKLIQRLSALEQQQLPFATMNALNDSMFDVRKGWQSEIGNVFDAPVSLTVNAVLYKKATKANLVAEVFLRNETFKGTPPSRYLISEVQGGAREEKPFEDLLRKAGILGPNEFVVPAKNAPLDAFGNVPLGVVTAILSDVAAARDSLAFSSGDSRRRRGVRNRKKAGTGTYFYSRGDKHLPRAIYERKSRSFTGPSQGGSGLRMIFVVVSGAPRYRKRFDATALAQEIFNRSFPIRFRERMLQALRTAKIK